MVKITQSILDNREKILALWTEAAEQAASARGLSAVAFRNMIAQYLSALADSPTQGDEARQLLLEQHLSSRLRQGFELAEIVNEISLLGECVAALWANSIPSERPDPVQVHSFYARLQRDTGLVSAVFTRHMLEDEQREKRFRRSIWNLASNAAKYGAVDAPVTLEVTRTQTGARLSVHNLGPVISAEEQKRLFVPFSRSSNGQAGLPQGWGLGLASVRACAEAHWGGASLTSDAASGTTFYLDLPCPASD